MDFLGKEGEKAAEAVQNLSQRLEDVESHVNAVDNAVQEVRQESRETDLKIAEENRDRLKELEQLMLKLTDIQKKNVKETETEESREIRLEEKVQALDKRLKRTRQDQKNIQNKLNDLEEKIYDVEEELTNEVELNQSRIEPCITESDVEGDFKEIRQEISQLKTSVNALASDLEDDNIRIE